MNCRASRRRLSAFVDGDLNQSDAFTLRHHVQACVQCRREANHLRRLKLTAAELEDLEPPSDLLQRTLVRLDDEPEQRRFFFPTMAAAVAVAASAAGVVFWTASSDSTSAELKSEAVAARAIAVSTSDSEYEAVEQHYRASVDSLRRIAAGESVRWPVARRSRFERDVALFERAVERSRAAVRLSRLDPQTRELHFAAYRQQIRYLQDAILSGVAAPPRQIPGGRANSSHLTPAIPAAWQP